MLRHLIHTGEQTLKSGKINILHPRKIDNHARGVRAHSALQFAPSLRACFGVQSLRQLDGNCSGHMSGSFLLPLYSRSGYASLYYSEMLYRCGLLTAGLHFTNFSVSRRRLASQ